MTTDSPKPPEGSVAMQALAYLKSRAPVLFFILNADFRVLDAGVYARSVIGNDVVGTRFQDLLIDFQGSVDLPKMMAKTEMEHLLSVNTRSGMPQSFLFHFESAGNVRLAFGRYDEAQLERLRTEILSLNRDLSGLTRSLHQKNAQLERLNREKNRFLGMATHDLRRPVSAILSYTEFLIDEASTALTQEQTGFLQTIHQATALMGRVIDDFLDASLIEASRFHLDRVLTDIRKPIDRSVALNRPAARQRSVRLEVIAEGPLPVVMMDAARIEQVLNNLIANAITHTPPETAVTVAASENSGGLRITVADAGPGVAPEVMGKLFTHYGRGSDSKLVGGRSTGLGLAISKITVEAHGGRIWANSRPGDGAVFSFTLPAAPRQTEISPLNDLE